MEKVIFYQGVSFTRGFFFLFYFKKKSKNLNSQQDTSKKTASFAMVRGVS